MFFQKKKPAHLPYLLLGLFLLLSIFFFLSSALQFQKIQELQNSLKVLAQEVVTLKQDSIPQASIEQGIQATVGIYGKNLTENLQSPQFLGSGVFVQTTESSVHIVTNYHVIANISGLSGKSYDGKEFELEVVSSDATVDIALLACKGTCPEIKALIPAKNARVGMPILAIGFHEAFPLLRFGYLSGISKDNNLILSTSIHNGFSGGPVLSSAGELIGIAQGFSLEEDISYAIPTSNILTE